jgi:competence protein ComEA
MRSRRVSFAALAFGLLLLAFGSSSPAAEVDINTADAATMARELKGIGIKRAEAIVEYRQKHGPFKSADELALVKGIGPAAIEKNRAQIRLGGARGGAGAAAKPSAGTSGASTTGGRSSQK